MGHRNTQFNGHMIDLEINQQGQRHPYEPRIFYGNPANYPQTIFPHHIPEHRGTTLFYGIPQCIGFQPQHLDLAIATPSGHYYPYRAPPSCIRDFPVQVNHGAHGQLSLSSYGRDRFYMDDDLRGPSKTKNASTSSSSSTTTGPAESDLNLVDGGIDPASMVGSGSLRRNRPGMIGPESIPSHRDNTLIQGNYVDPPVQFPGNPWLDTYAWSNLVFVHGGVNGACVQAGNIGVHGYQHPSLPHNQAPPTQGVREYNVNNLPSQVATSSRRILTVHSSNGGINHVQDVVQAEPIFLAPIVPMGFRWYPPQHREIILDSSPRHNTLPHLRVLPEDEDIPGYREPVNSTDQHRDMRLDIDQMSYEELLALGEQMGSVGSGLSEEFVHNNLEVRTFNSEAARVNLEEAICSNQQTNFCVICQNDYEDEENIGTLDCGHKYHSECIQKWLLVKNTCPVCKSTALSSNSNRKDS